MEIEKLNVLEVKVARLIDETIALRNEKLNQERLLEVKEEEIRNLTGRLQELEEERGSVKERIDNILSKLEDINVI